MRLSETNAPSSIWRIHEKGNSECSGCCRHDGRRDYNRRGPAFRANSRCNSRLACGAFSNSTSTLNAATSPETGDSEIPRGTVRLGAGQLGLEWRLVGVGFRKLGASAKARGGLASRTLESPRPGCCVGWRVLEIKNRQMRDEGRQPQRTCRGCGFGCSRNLH